MNCLKPMAHHSRKSASTPTIIGTSNASGASTRTVTSWCAFWRYRTMNVQATTPTRNDASIVTPMTK